MTLALIVYFLGMINSLQFILIMLLISSTIAIVVTAARNDIHADSGGPWGYKKWVVSLIASISLLVILPSERTAYMMLGAYATQEITTAVIHTDEAKNIGNNILKIIDNKIESFADSKEEK